MRSGRDVFEGIIPDENHDSSRTAHFRNKPPLSRSLK